MHVMITTLKWQQTIKLLSLVEITSQPLNTSWNKNSGNWRLNCSCKLCGKSSREKALELRKQRFLGAWGKCLFKDPTPCISQYPWLLCCLGTPWLYPPLWSRCRTKHFPMVWAKTSKEEGVPLSPRKIPCNHQHSFEKSARDQFRPLLKPICVSPSSLDQRRREEGVGGWRKERRGRKRSSREVEWPAHICLWWYLHLASS